MTTTAPSVSVPTATPQRGSLPLVAAGITVLLWASAFIGIRASGEHYSPGALALGRLLVGSVALTVVVVANLVLRRASKDAPLTSSVVQGAPVNTGRRLLPRGRTLWLVIAYGVLWFGVYNVSLNAAERHVDAGTAALLVGLGPILIAVLAGVLLGEGFPRRLVAGILVAVVGLVAIGIATSTGHRDLTGVLLAVGAAVLYAAGALLQKQALAGTTPLPATWLGCLIGTVVCLPYAPTLVHELAGAPAGATLGIVYLGLFPTAVAFLTWGYALSRTSAGTLATSTYASPALAVLMSWLILAEVPGVLALVGGALCLAGVAVSRLPARRRASA